MRRLLLIAVVALTLPLPARAQQKIQAELFTGYSFANIKVGDRRINTNGWRVAFAYSGGSDWLEFVADVSGHYGSLSDVGINMHTATFGTRTSLRTDNFKFFVHSLYGVSRLRASAQIFGNELPRNSAVSFAFVPGGGGIDLVLSDGLRVRLLQFDLLFTTGAAHSSRRYEGGLHTQFSSGLAFRFGKR